MSNANELTDIVNKYRQNATIAKDVASFTKSRLRHM